MRFGNKARSWNELELMKLTRRRFFYGILVNTLTLIVALQWGRLKPEWTLIISGSSFYMLGAGTLLGMINATIQPIIDALSLPKTLAVFLFFTAMFSFIMIMLINYGISGIALPGTTQIIIVTVMLTVANWLYAKLEV